jgi:hypothetical protein
MFRILITGSRDWTDESTLYNAISDLKNWYNFQWEDVVIVHGDCPTGADALADHFASQADLTTERHPADWEQFGKFAGPKRNQEMVDAGADVVLAFPKGLSKGTRGTIKKAQDAGLTVKIYEG